MPFSSEIDLIEHCINLQELGVGEIFLNCVDRDGTGNGYDLETIRLVSDAISVPLRHVVVRRVSMTY